MSQETKKRRKIDWDAIERDYRTGHFTLRELEAKYGVDNATIARKVKRDGWKQDLSEAVRQATNALVISKMVSSEISEGQQNVSNAVLAAAEINARVVRRQQERLESMERAADEAYEKLKSIEHVNDVREAAAYMSAASNYIACGKSLTELERKVYKLDDEGDKKSEQLLVEDFIEALNAQAQP